MKKPYNDASIKHIALNAPQTQGILVFQIIKNAISIVFVEKSY